MQLTDAQFDPKSHLSEVMWAETLSNTVEYKKLEELQRSALVQIEERLASPDLSPRERDRQAFLRLGFKTAITMLRKHHENHLKLHTEEARNDLPDAPKREPVL